MKVPVSILLLFTFSFVNGQINGFMSPLDSEEFVQFQVLDARNAYYNGSELNQFDRIQKNGNIKITSDGFLSIVHSSGKAFEFNNKTVFNLDTLSISTKKSVYFSIDLSMLFNLKELKRSGVIVLATAPPFEIISPINKQFVASKNQMVCFQWRWIYEDRHDNFILTFKNFFHEPILDTIKIKGFGYELDLSLFDELNLELNKIFVEVSEYKTNIWWTHEIAIELTDTNYIQPIELCNISNATEAVMAGFLIESFNFYPKDAIAYYEMAVDLSEEEVFKSLLEHAKTRLSYRN